MMFYPKVLVISPVKFNQETGSGVTMSNLFKGWPLDKIAQIHSDNYTTADEKVCRNYKYLPYYQVRQSSSIGTFVEFCRQGIKYVTNQQVSLAGHWLHTKDLIQWCQDFNPDLIYTRPHPRPSFYIWLPLLISRKLRIPFVTRILDDWPAKLNTEPSFFRRLYWKRILSRQTQRIFQQAAINIGISKEMCEEFTKRYEAQFLPFHNCIDIDEWRKTHKDYRSSDPFSIVYLGTVTKDKELSSLLNIRTAILRLRDCGYNVHLTLYGPNIYRDLIEKHLTHPPQISFGGYFPLDMKQQILSEADLLLLPINFDPTSQLYVGYSFQTKVPEYMASGTPTLVYGPPSNPNIRYAKEYNWAYVVERDDIELLEKAFITLIENINLRTELGQISRELAFQHHNAEVVRKKFQTELSKIGRRNDQ